jgi:hypothetical protein
MLLGAVILGGVGLIYIFAPNAYVVPDVVQTTGAR